ncbi:MAG: class I SAM-dependent methyltransferase [Planctomycetota bacterium]
MQPHESCWTSAFGEVSSSSNEPSENHSVSLAHENSGGARTKTGTEPETDGHSEFDLEDVSKFFDSISAEYGGAIRRCVPRYDEMTWAMFEYLPDAISNAADVLELGCGTGNLTEKLIQQFPNGCLTLVDISASSIEACQKRFREVEAVLNEPAPVYQRMNFRTADFRELEYEAGSFDLVTSAISIHHLTSVEKQQLFAAVFDWLRPGGVFVFADQFAGATTAIYEKHIQNWHAYTRQAGASQAEWDMWMEHQQEHDYHDPLGSQWSWLEEAGFTEVDCQWRHLLWTVLSARKSA